MSGNPNRRKSQPPAPPPEDEEEEGEGEEGEGEEVPPQRPSAAEEATPQDAEGSETPAEETDEAPRRSSAARPSAADADASAAEVTEETASVAEPPEGAARTSRGSNAQPPRTSRKSDAEPPPRPSAAEGEVPPEESEGEPPTSSGTDRTETETDEGETDEGETDEAEGETDEGETEEGETGEEYEEGEGEAEEAGTAPKEVRPSQEGKAPAVTESADRKVRLSQAPEVREETDEEAGAGVRKESRRPKRTMSGSEVSEYGEEDEEKGREKAEAGEEGAQQATQPKKQRAHSVTAQLHVEIAKQRLAQAKQNREQRRAGLEAHHYFLIEQVASHIDLKPKEIEEFIIDSQNFIDLMDSFLGRRGCKAIIFSYQLTEPAGPDSGRPLLVGAAKREKVMRVVISNGTDIQLKGTCMVFMRVHNENKVAMNTIAEEVCFTTVEIKEAEEPGYALATVCDLLQKLYLKYMKNNNTWVSIADPENAAAVRHRFITSVDHYADFLANCKNDINGRLDLTKICDMNEIYEKHLKTADEVLESAKNPEIVAKVEHAVILWCKNIEKVLALSKQMRKETDDMGPTAELAYWRNLMAKMCDIIQQVQKDKFMNFIQCLIQSKSRVFRRWKDVDARVTDEFHEAKDNVRYMYALEKFCVPLYQNDPPSMAEHINSMMYTIHTIHTTSRYYNSTEKVTALMVKISNQMVAACRRYLTQDGKETVWSQDKRIMVEKLNECLKLYATYRGSYETTKQELENNTEGRRFNFSVNHIFGRFDQFCERLKKIIQLVEIFDMYKFVHLSHIDGLEVISDRLNNLSKEIEAKDYDPLEFRRDDFDKDFGAIRTTLDEIQTSLEEFMDKTIENCPTAMHGLQLLERFKNLRNRCLNIEDKQWYLFQFYNNEITMLNSVYEAEKNETPTPRGFPPFCGKIAWSRHLYRRLERPMVYFKKHTKVLERDEAKPIIKAFNALSKKLILYEVLFHDAFCKQCPSIYDALEAPLLTMKPGMKQELVLNFDPFFRQIIEETEVLRKLELEVPEIAQVVYHKQEKLFQTYEQMKSLLDRFNAVRQRVPSDLMLLIRPLLKKVEKAFMPGVHTINWTSFKCDEYFKFITEHLDEFEEMTMKVTDIVGIQLAQCLRDISHTLMVDLPEETPMYVNEFMEKIRRYAAIVSKDLEYKSRACESAVIQLINTLLNGTIDPDIPPELVSSWLNESLFEHQSSDKGRRDNSGLSQLVSTLSPGQKEELRSSHEECRHVFMIYSQKFIEALQKTTRISLDILRKRTEEPPVKRKQAKVENRVPLFNADLILAIPNIQVKPPLEEIQLYLKTGVQIVIDVLKHVVFWGQVRRSSFDASAEEKDTVYKDPIKDAKEAAQAQKFERLLPQEQMLRAQAEIRNLNEKLKNVFKSVIDYKDISKMVLLMQSVVTQSKPRLADVIKKCMGYAYLWGDERTAEIKKKLEQDLSITEIEALVREYKSLDEEINELPETYRVGPMDLTTKELKLGLTLEIKEWQKALCKLLHEEYQGKVASIAKFVDESSKDLNTPIKDMNDIRFVMSVLDKIRDKFVEQDLAIGPIEEVYGFLLLQGHKVGDEEQSRVDTLRASFNELQAKALEVQNKIWTVQEANRKKLIESVTNFQRDLKAYVSKYKTGGPAVAGISPDYASDRLVIFQDEFDQLKERYTLCNAGEKLFGLPQSKYPDMVRLQKELKLLQKLYNLYNDVIRWVSEYNEKPHQDEAKISTDLGEFQKRAKNLPKALKEWPAFTELKKEIDEFKMKAPVRPSRSLLHDQGGADGEFPEFPDHEHDARESVF